MNPMSSHREWSRLSPISGVIFLANTGKGLLQAAPGLLPAFIILRNNRFAEYGVPIAISAAIFLFGIWPIIHWYFFRYKITNEQVLIRSGVVNRKRLSIDFDRIQGIKLSQNPIFRLFRVFNLGMDTAGSAKEEVALPGVQRHIVDLIRSNIDGVNQKIEPTQPPSILRLNFWEVIKIGLTSNALIFIAVIAAPVLSLPDSLVLKFFRRVFESSFEYILQGVVGLPTWLTVIVFASLVLLLLGLVVTLSVLSSVIRYHKFELTNLKDRLVSTSGMLTRHEQSIPLRKIQLLRVDQNLRQRIFKCFSVSLRQASSQQSSSKKNFRVPYTNSPLLISSISTPGFDLHPDDPNLRNIDSRYIFRTLRNVWLAPLVAITLLMTSHFGAKGILALLGLFPAYLIVRQSHRRWAYLFRNGYALVRTGLLGKTHSLFELRRTQRISITQTPFQRRKDLANITFHLASNKVSIPYIPGQIARQLQDEVLYQVETDVLPWI